MHPNQIHNKYINTKLEEGIRFCPSTRKNESLMFFSADLSVDNIAQKVRSIDVMKDVAHILRKEIKFVLLVSKSIVMHLIYKTHVPMERLNKMQKHLATLGLEL